MRNSVKITALVLLLFTTVCSQNKKAEVPKAETKAADEKKDAGSLSIKYIANEGVLISAGEKQILLDALHREYKPDYLFPPADLLKSLETAQKPYDRINLLLVSHIHLDHFHPQSVGLHLKNNPRAALVSSEQVAGEVAKEFADYEKIKPQIKPVKHVWKQTVEIVHDGIKVKILGLRHGGARFASIENLGHVIEIGGRKLLHIGDADMTAENFAAFNLSKENIDVAMIPFWFLLSEDGRRLVREQFNPKQIIAVHISPNDAAKVSAELKREIPDLITFTKVLEEKSF